METKHDMKAILGEDFFREEVRCDYLISAEMKSVFAILIDLYLTFAELCDKYGLRYYAMSGFLLGAIRHNGFIPWDDDLDVAMPRDDYNKLMEIAPKELEYPYFLRTPYTDPECFYSSIVLMNLSTSFVPKIFRNNKFKMGIPMDIFPLDYCDLKTYDSDRALIYNHIMKCSTYMKRNVKDLTDRQKSDQLLYKTTNPLYDWEQIQKIASNKAYYRSDNVAFSVLTTTDKKHLIFPSKCFKNTKKRKFESIEVIIPAEYEPLLTLLYGDYNQFPPIDQRGLKNNQIIMDPYNPFYVYTDNK